MLVNFPNCCSSYPIPLVLIIYRDGRIVHRVRPSVLQPIWKWIFVDGGRRVAYYSETVHGGLGRRCELLDLETGKVVDVWDREGHGRSKDKGLPDWGKPFANEMADSQ